MVVPEPDIRGKVRDIYDLGDRLLLVASDRISAFDVVLAEPIPQKGVVLTALTGFWLDQLGDRVENHRVSTDPADLPEARGKAKNPGHLTGIIDKILSIRLRPR